MKKHWNLTDMPDQARRTVLITGANDGLGLHMSKAFARKNARVVMACRNQEKAARAREEIRAGIPGADLDVVQLDLGDRESVASCAADVIRRYSRLDVLIGNAGIMAVPFGTNRDGIELHMAVNYYGHYALFGRLLPLIGNTPGGRIVTVSSVAEKFGTLNLDRPTSARSYDRWRAYSDSKLAMLMLALILDEKLKREGSEARSVAAHPGFASTNLRHTRLETETNAWHRLSLKILEGMAMPVERGILPILCAATEPSLAGGEYVGVSGLFEVHGAPKITRGQGRAYDSDLRRKLVEKSEALTGAGLCGQALSGPTSSPGTS